MNWHIHVDRKPLRSLLTEELISFLQVFWPVQLIKSLKLEQERFFWPSFCIYLNNKRVFQYYKQYVPFLCLLPLMSKIEYYNNIATL